MKITRFFTFVQPSNQSSHYHYRNGGWVRAFWRETVKGMYYIKPFFRRSTYVRKRNRNSDKTNGTRPMSLYEFLRSRGIQFIRRNEPKNLDVFLNSRPAIPQPSIIVPKKMKTLFDYQIKNGKN